MFKENVPLSEISSYKIGGPARYFFEAKNADELKKAVEEAKNKNLDFFIIGSGTNFLISDEGYPGLVIKMAIDFIESSGTEVSVGAGALMSDLVAFSIKNNLSGLEWAGGLPGTVGGAIRGNAGAFGGEIKDSIKKVKSFDTGTLGEKERSSAECEFGYRHSIFKNPSNREIILSAVFDLRNGDGKEIEKSVNEKIAHRKERQPLEYPNAGSIFKNVDLKKIPAEHLARFEGKIKRDPFPVIPTAFIISEAGLKGISSGGAMISPKHPNFIVNISNAKALDVKNLIELVKKEVKNKFGIELEEEIIFV